jgi:hypothetical protein
MISLVEELRMRRGLLSAKKAAERLSMNLQVLYRRAKAGEVPHLRIFGRVKCDPRILATWLEARQVSCTLRFDQALSGPKSFYRGCDMTSRVFLVKLKDYLPRYSPCPRILLMEIFGGRSTSA